MVKYQTEWTQNGRRFLYLLLKEKGYIPIVEQQLMNMGRPAPAQASFGERNSNWKNAEFNTK